MTDRAAGRRPGDGMTTGRILLVVFGAIAAFSGLALGVGGGVLLWAHSTQRDADGFYTTSTERFTTETYALTSNVDLGQAPGEHDWTLAHPVGTVRIRATGSEGDRSSSESPHRPTWIAGSPASLILMSRARTSDRSDLTSRR